MNNVHSTSTFVNRGEWNLIPVNPIKIFISPLILEIGSWGIFESKNWLLSKLIFRKTTTIPVSCVLVCVSSYKSALNKPLISSLEIEIEVHITVITEYHHKTVLISHNYIGTVGRAESHYYPFCPAKILSHQSYSDSMSRLGLGKRGPGPKFLIE